MYGSNWLGSPDLERRNVMFEDFDIWYDDRLGREEGRTFVIEILERTDAQNVNWTIMSFTVEEAKRICEYIQEQLSLHEDHTET